jgi:apolipoprotein N-acyltransferase
MPESSEAASGGRELARDAGLALLSAVLFALSFEPARLWVLCFLSPAPLAWLALRARRTRRTALLVVGAHLVAWLLMQAWLLQVTPLGYPLLALYLALYPGIFFIILSRAAATPATAAWPMTILVPVTWVALEFLRGHVVMNGYPWFLLGHPTIDIPAFAQAADLGGAYLVSFLVATVSGALVDLSRRGGDAAFRRRARVAAALAALLGAANLGYGAFRLSQPAPSGTPLRVLVIQTNLPQDNKTAWSIAAQYDDFRRFLDQTLEAHRQAAGSGPVDLVVWPETMLPGFGLEPATIRTLLEGRLVPGDDFARAIAELQRVLETPLLVGSVCYEGLRVADGAWAWDAHYNSAYLLTATGRPQRYDKHFLTPFGETMPYISAWEWLEKLLLRLGARGMSFDLDASPDVSVLALPGPAGGLGIGTPICYEDTIPWVCRRMVYQGGAKRAGLLVNLSNDGWFGWFDGGRAQHNQAARFRCIEGRVPMVRAANTGQSAAFDSRGKSAGAIGRGRYGEARRSGALLAELHLDPRTTVYGRVGDLWGWLCLVSLLLLVGFGLLRRRGVSQRSRSA